MSGAVDRSVVLPFVMIPSHIVLRPGERASRITIDEHASIVAGSHIVGKYKSIMTPTCLFAS